MADTTNTVSKSEAKSALSKRLAENPLLTDDFRSKHAKMAAMETRHPAGCRCFDDRPESQCVTGYGMFANAMDCDTSFVPELPAPVEREEDEMPSHVSCSRCRKDPKKAAFNSECGQLWLCLPCMLEDLSKKLRLYEDLAAGEEQKALLQKCVDEFLKGWELVKMPEAVSKVLFDPADLGAENYCCHNCHQVSHVLFRQVHLTPELVNDPSAVEGDLSSKSSLHRLLCGICKNRKCRQYVHFRLESRDRDRYAEVPVQELRARFTREANDHFVRDTLAQELAAMRLDLLSFRREEWPPRACSGCWSKLDLNLQSVYLACPTRMQKAGVYCHWCALFCEQKMKLQFEGYSSDNWFKERMEGGNWNAQGYEFCGEFFQGDVFPAPASPCSPPYYVPYYAQPDC
eukprot:jgi/Mesvir1/5588/Mv15607-RA.1